MAFTLWPQSNGQLNVGKWKRLPNDYRKATTHNMTQPEIYIFNPEAAVSEVTMFVAKWNRVVAAWLYLSDALIYAATLIHHLNS